LWNRVRARLRVAARFLVSAAAVVMTAVRRVVTGILTAGWHWVRRNRLPLIRAAAAILTAGLVLGAVHRFGPLLPDDGEEVLRFLTHYASKFLITAILLGVALACVGEVYRLWFVRKVVIRPFTYTRDGAEVKDGGGVFVAQVAQDLRLLDQLIKRYLTPSPDQAPADAAATYSGTAALIPELIAAPVPGLADQPLADVEIQVQGVNLTSLVRTANRWVHPPTEFVGVIAEQDKRFTAQIELRHGTPVRAARKLPPLVITDRDNLGQASFATACQILYLSAADRQLAAGRTDILDRYTATEFELFFRGLREYDLFLARTREHRADPAAADRALAEADRLLTGLCDDGTQLNAAFWLAGKVKLAGKDEASKRAGAALLQQYLARTEGPGAAASAAKPLAGVANPPPEIGDGRIKVRPVAPGVSVGAVGGNTVTVCCFVVTKEGKKAMLTASSLVREGGAALGTPVIQPGPVDGGTDADVIGRLERYAELSPKGANRVAATLVSVGGEVTNKGPFGQIAGTAEPVVTMRVRKWGRTTGHTEGVVDAIDATARIAFGSRPDDIREFHGLVMCRGTFGSPFSLPGDSGAPVLDPEGRLIGMVLASSGDVTFVIPIGVIFDFMKVDRLLPN
jgi:hypothetical protein